MSNVTALKPVVTKRKQVIKRVRTDAPRQTSKQLKRQHRMGYAFGGLALTLVGLSLSHLAEGVMLVTHRPMWEAGAVAVAIDAGFVAAELMPFAVTSECAAETRTARLILTGCVLFASATFNAMAFAADAKGMAMQVAGCAMGVALPGAVGLFLHLASRCILGKAR